MGQMTRPKTCDGIGFRGLKIFNQALLARQAWRLIQHTGSFCARLLEAKYYPSANLLDTAFIQNASPTWQGIEFGLELLKKGTIWRIGSGSSVKIFSDNWSPCIDTRKLVGRRGGSRRRWVSELINPDTRTWNFDGEQEELSFFIISRGKTVQWQEPGKGKEKRAKNNRNKTNYSL
jgi:hypothetical protein